MNKNKVKTLIIFVTGLLVGLCINYNSNQRKVFEDESIKINKNFVAMMVETGAGTGEYTQSNSNEWLTDGYSFNSVLSGCENGGILSWDDTNKKIIMESNITEKCYVYFDKYNSITINDYSINSSGNKIIILISASSGTGTISKYFYSKDDGATYIESTSNSYTFTNLDKGTYKIKAYVLDSNNKKSNILSKTIEITTLSISDYVIGKYTGVQGENGLYYHDSNLTNGAGDNSYRYAGASESVNNYVCFGSDNATCPEDNLYRIIGIFDGRTKLIKADYASSNLLGTDGDYSQTGTIATSSGYVGSLTTLDTYYWNYKNNTSVNSGKGLNTWSTSLLNKTNLNTNYLNNIGSKWANMIAVSTWKVGGNNGSNIYDAISSVAYQNEIVNAGVTYEAKIGLMYATDWGFAINQNRWNRTLNNYGFSGIENENWLYLGLHEFLITRNIDNSYFVFCILNTGQTFNFNAAVATAIRPTFYLNSSINYSSGDGTKTNPIRITN